jgi:hypothetical protein
MTPLRALIRRLDGARNLADACEKKLYRRYSCALLAPEAVMMRLVTTLARPAALAQPAARAPRAGQPTSRNVSRPRAAAPAAFASRGAVAPWAGRRTAGARRVAAAVRVRAFASLGLRGSSQASRSARCGRSDAAHARRQAGGDEEGDEAAAEAEAEADPCVPGRASTLRRPRNAPCCRARRAPAAPHARQAAQARPARPPRGPAASHIAPLSQHTR